MFILEILSKRFPLWLVWCQVNRRRSREVVSGGDGKPEAYRHVLRQSRVTSVIASTVVRFAAQTSGSAPIQAKSNGQDLHDLKKGFSESCSSYKSCLNAFFCGWFGVRL
jgi:hypothetical protein